MTRFRRVALLVSASHAATLLVLMSAASPASADGLEQALSAAYLSNPDLDAERARLRATDENVSRAYSGFRPRLEGNAFSGERTYETKPMLPESDKSTPIRGYQLALKQPLFRGGRTLSSIAQAEASSEGGQAKLRSVEIKTLLAAATAYADVRRDRATLALQRSNVSALQAEVTATKARLDAQAATIADVSQAEARVAAARANVDKAVAEVKTSEARYEEVVGHRPGDLPQPRDLAGGLIPGSLEQALQAAQDENPQVLAAVKAEAAASHNIDTVRGELLPEVTLEGSWTKTFDPESGVDMTNESTIVGRVRMPLYEGGDTYARVRQAKEQHLAAIQDVRSLRSQAQTNVVSAWSHLESARAQQSSSQARITAARKALTGLRSELQIGGRSVVDVLNAQQEVIDAEIADAIVKREVLVATYEVLAATGDLTIERLGLIDTVYDAEAHLAEVALKPFGTSISADPQDGFRVPAWMTSGPFARPQGEDGAPFEDSPWSAHVVAERHAEVSAPHANPSPTDAAGFWTTAVETGSLPSNLQPSSSVWRTVAATTKYTPQVHEWATTTATSVTKSASATHSKGGSDTVGTAKMGLSGTASSPRASAQSRGGRFITLRRTLE